MPPGVDLLMGGSVTSPGGFIASGVSCGLKESGALDLGLLASIRPAVSGLVMTTSALPAAPVIRNRALARGSIHGVVVNSGNANADTGEQGLRDAHEMGTRAALGLGLPIEQMAVSSTGVIGRLFAMDKVRAGIDAALRTVSSTAGADFAQAICTTDRAPKAGAFALRQSSGARVTIGAAAKGAGMISPTMATMLAYLTTDAAIRADDLQDVVAWAAERSFNRISVDGQMSPSDTLLVIANGEGEPLAGEDLTRFAQCVAGICRWLAIQMVKDGEGAEHAVRLMVEGAADDDEAHRVARQVGNSPLVKAAIHGRDPNWGRVSQAVGQALVGATGAIEPTLTFDEIPVADPRVREVMERSEYDVTVGLGRGRGSAELWICDLTHAYVSLNADYTT